MTFDEFIKKWLGKKADYDGFYGGQCVDIFRFYVEEVLGFPQSPGVGGATEIWYSAQPKYYDFIKNTPTAVPQKGDIPIWNRNAGDGFGHVSIFIEGNVNRFTSLDQNWPTLDKVTKTKHDYKNIIGWLRPKKDSAKLNFELEECLKIHTKLVNETTKLKKENDRLSGEIKSQEESFTLRVKSAEDELKEWKGDYKDLLAYLASNLGDPVIRDERSIKPAFEKALGFEDLYAKAVKKTDVLNGKAVDKDRLMEILEGENKTLKTQLRSAKGLDSATSKELATQLVLKISTIDWIIKLINKLQEKP